MVHLFFFVFVLGGVLMGARGCGKIEVIMFGLEGEARPLFRARGDFKALASVVCCC